MKMMQSEIKRTENSQCNHHRCRTDSLLDAVSVIKSQIKMIK